MLKQKKNRIPNFFSAAINYAKGAINSILEGEYFTR